MDALEHRIPPPAVAILVAATMWLVAVLLPAMEIGRMLRVGLEAAFGLSSAIFVVGGFSAFRRARTTIDPLHIDQATTLVTTGIYGLTRNPMYVGLALLLCAWACYLALPWTVAGPLAFVAFITRFQVIPEERVLSEKFGKSYADYRRRVRRWI